jgi:hypothetical protein
VAFLQASLSITTLKRQRFEEGMIQIMYYYVSIVFVIVKCEKHVPRRVHSPKEFLIFIIHVVRL